MPLRLATQDPGFDAAFATLLAAKREVQADVGAVVAGILADVAKRGDAAVLEYTSRFDRHDLAADGMRVAARDIDAAVRDCDPALLDALSQAAARIEAFHVKLIPGELNYRDADGVRLGARWTAVESVGLYVPGGTAAYPSSVLMTAIPARVAGVERIAMVAPAPGGRLNPLVLAAAKLAGVTEIYRIGGAQAVAALAYGTSSIPAVVKIVGPGNAYVAAAKRQVFGQVGIDMIAGPSEILVVADRNNDPAWIATDLLSQAEHDEAAQAILICDDAVFGDAVVAAVECELKSMDRSAIAAASWRDNGAVIVVDELADAVALIDRIAPEHLELAIADPEQMALAVRNAGAIFLGRYTPEAIGDYVGGPNHVLPTARSARFSSGLSVLDFMKRTTFIGCDAESLARIGPAAITLARAEGLGAHARSIAIRLNGSGGE
ncbi:MAG: Histidinol dehydrogenase [Alphaproteobacteria bacterium MarineAlpha10_Bin3]|jgi:histidinol dehydrogenase|nr:MAG: Histidinol dehydrogenase [Alphaproteobacteria bacterium MarineAlpha10_Bin3]PPR67328.1 MAG: Histidinol dehydrogenase [Alphaproteobacteria bacterium MarineAlpha4_Bin1]